MPANVHVRSLEILWGGGSQKAKFFKEILMHELEFLSCGGGLKVSNLKPSLGKVGIFTGIPHQ